MVAKTSRRWPASRAAGRGIVSGEPPPRHRLALAFGLRRAVEQAASMKLFDFRQVVCGGSFMNQCCPT